MGGHKGIEIQWFTVCVWDQTNIDTCVLLLMLCSGEEKVYAFPSL